MQQIALAHLYFISQMIFRHILAGYAHSHAVDIYRLNFFSSAQRSCNSQNAAAGSHVKNHSVLGHYAFQTLHHHIRSMVRPGAKGHTWVNFDNVLPGLRLVFLPAGLNHQRFAHMSHMKILLPFIGPVLLGHPAKARIAKAIFADAQLHLLQGGLNLRQALLQLIVVRIIAAHIYYFSILLLRNIAQLPSSARAQLVNQLRVLYHHALRPGLRQNIRHCLHSLVRHRHIDLYPIAHLSYLLSCKITLIFTIIHFQLS